MKKKLISLLLLLVMVLSPVVLSGCFFGLGGGGGGGSSDSGGGDGDTGTEEEETDPTDPSNFANVIKSIKAVEMLDMSKINDTTSQAYIFTSEVMRQVDTLSREILVRLCAYYGYGVTAVLPTDPEGINKYYGIVQEPVKDISWYAIHDFEGDMNGGSRMWAWKPVTDTNVWQVLTANEYVDYYINAYEAESKPDYHKKLKQNIYNLLTGTMPADVEDATLRQAAAKLDHIGFTEDEQKKISDFILSDVIGSANVSYDSGRGDAGNQYAATVPKIIKECMERAGGIIYPCVAAVNFQDRKLDDFSINLFGEDGVSPFTGNAAAYTSIIIGNGVGNGTTGLVSQLDIKGFSLSFEITDPRVTEAVGVDIYGKYQNGETVYRGKLADTFMINPGMYNMNDNANDITIEFSPPSADDFGDMGEAGGVKIEIDPSTLPDNSVGNEFYKIHNLTALRLGLFKNNTATGTIPVLPIMPAQTGEKISTLSDPAKYGSYFKTYGENGVSNVEYVDNETSFIQIFFKFNSEISDIKFKIAFMNIEVSPIS